MSIVFNPIIPISYSLFLGLVFLAGTIYVYLSVGNRLGRTQNIFLLAMRLLALALVILILLQPSRREEIHARPLERVLLVALDTSRSMNQKDLGKNSRLGAAIEILEAAKLTGTDTFPAGMPVRFYQFHEDASAVAAAALPALQAHGKTTRFHQSLTTLLNAASGGETASALVLLTDGHDFELVNYARTARLARTRQVPIYALPLGGKGRVRDVGVRIASYQPYVYVKQAFRISVVVRQLNCEFEDLSIELYREGKLLQTERRNAGEEREFPVSFEVTEPGVGQFEYEVRARPLPQEIETGNNATTTYVNVINKRISVLLLEGQPYWDTTFLQRALFRNDKINIDSIIQYSPERARRIRKQGGQTALTVPKSAAEFSRYDIVLLGKSTDQLLNEAQVKALDEYVRERSGCLIFTRGNAFDRTVKGASNLEPVTWDEDGNDHVRLVVARAGKSLTPFKILITHPGGLEELPELIAARKVIDRKTLAVTLAEARDEDAGEVSPAIVYRRVGRGQVVSIGVDGLWRWAFNAKADPENNLFDRFWDQLMLWLMAGSDFMPEQEYTFRTNTANLPLGEKIYFRLGIRTPQTAVKEIPVEIFHNGQAAGIIYLTRDRSKDLFRLRAGYLPDKPGRYKAVVILPQAPPPTGKGPATPPSGLAAKEERQEAKFMVYEDNLEETEVAVDSDYLRDLCEASGGSLLSAAELEQLPSRLVRNEVGQRPKIKLTSLWDRGWIFLLICIFFALDWHFRRKWGLC